MIEFDVGDVIDDRYEVIGEIGRGGMGIVLRVKEQDTGSEVALKYCPTMDEAAIRRFSREVRIMANIGHPHVMPVLAQNGIYDPRISLCRLLQDRLEKKSMKIWISKWL